MNSFFATVEQQVHPFLRGKAIGVAGRPGTRSIVAAASIEAKRGGIKTAMSTAEALARYPDLRLVVGNTTRYKAVSRQVVSIVLRYTPDVEVFSIDECFADITFAVKDAARRGRNPWQVAADIASAIKRAIRNEIGEYITCSIGIARNKFLAKLASDLFKPDGLHLVTPTVVGSVAVRVAARGPARTRVRVSQQDALLLATPIGEFCGLGPRLQRHLARIGIVTTADLRQADSILLRRIFGVVGQQLYEHAWGHDTRPVRRITDVPPPKSFSHAITLPYSEYRPLAARSYLSGLSEKVAFRMRQSGMMARRISCFVRFDTGGGFGGHRTLRMPIHDGRSVFEQADTIFNAWHTFRPIRLVGVGLSLVQPLSEVPAPLLIEDQQSERVLAALDCINSRFGSGTAVQARTLATRGLQSEATHAFGCTSKSALAAISLEGSG